jgi:DNA-binding response OmpR family regulator
MVKCPTCDQAMSIIVEIGALRVHTGAHLVSWHGEIIPLTETERRLVKAILMKGSATWEELKEALHPDGDVSTNLLNVSLAHLRRRLKEAEVAYDIKAIRGWGVILVDHDSGLPLRRRPSSNRMEKTSRHPTTRKSVVAH